MPDELCQPLLPAELRRVIILRRLTTALVASSIAVAPAGAAAQAPAEPPAEPSTERRRSGSLEGEALGYLAVPILLVLVIVAGLLVGGGDGETPAST